MSPQGRPKGECRSAQREGTPLSAAGAFVARRQPPVRREKPGLALTVQYGVASTTLPAPAALRRWARAAAERSASVTVRFVGQREGRTLNAVYRGKTHATNVLAFVYDVPLKVEGDIVLCAPVLRTEARAQGKTLADHCAHLVVHGMLHLQGYHHDTGRAARTMEARETAILAALGVPDPYASPVDARRMSGPRARSVDHPAERR
jgi:probable rRNA maturation factor